MEALFHEILAPPQDADVFAATAQVMDLDGAVCMRDDERKESGQGAEEKEEEETEKTLEGQQQQAQQDDGMKKILPYILSMFEPTKSMVEDQFTRPACSNIVSAFGCVLHISGILQCYIPQQEQNLRPLPMEFRLAYQI